MFINPNIATKNTLCLPINKTSQISVPHSDCRGVCSVRHSDPVTTSPDRSGQYGGGGAGYDNSMPDIRNPVDKLNVTAGELLQFQVKIR